MGGGIGVDLSSSPVIEDCLVQDNRGVGGGYGGGFASVGGSQGASSSILRNCQFIGNSAKDGGGAYFEYGTSLIEGCVFESNTSTDEGGGIHVSYSSHVTITGCQVKNNFSGFDLGGGIWNGLGGSSSLSGSVVCANSPGQIAGPWEDNGSNYIGEVCPNTWVVAQDGSGDFTTIQSAIDAAFTGDTVLIGPGVYQVSDGSAVVSLGGKRITLRGTVDPQSGQPLTIVDGQNKRTGFYCTDLASGGSFIEDIEFTNGYSSAGSAAHVRNAVLTFNNCVFSNSYCFDTGAGNGYGCGAGLYTYLVSDIHLNDCVFRGNECEVSGAGLYLHEVNGHLEGCVFENNESGMGGGAVSCHPGSYDANFNGCTFSGNIAGFGGGGLAIETSVSASVMNCVFVNNQAQVGGGGWTLRLSVQPCD